MCGRFKGNDMLSRTKHHRLLLSIALVVFCVVVLLMIAAIHWLPRNERGAASRLFLLVLLEVYAALDLVDAARMYKTHQKRAFRSLVVRSASSAAFGLCFVRPMPTAVLCVALAAWFGIGNATRRAIVWTKLGLPST
jgi:hypothetical protein